MSERDKMLAGELYDPFDPELAEARVKARDLCQALSATREVEQDERRRLLTALFGAGGGRLGSACWARRTLRVSGSAVD